MPAKTEAQRELFAIAEHHPDKLFKKNKKILGSMSKGQMHDFAATKGLKKHVDSEKGEPKDKETGPGETSDKVKKLKALRAI
jgi:hypothetical protein